MVDTLFTNRAAFEKALDKSLKAEGVKIAGPVKKAVLSALSERDDEADVCTGKDGNSEPDTALRDHELVPFKDRSEEHTSELQSLMRISYAVFCLKKKNKQ